MPSPGPVTRISKGAGCEPIDLVRELLDAILELERLLRVCIGLGPVAIPLVGMRGEGFIGLCADLLHRAAGVLLELDLVVELAQLRLGRRGLALPHHARKAQESAPWARQLGVAAAHLAQLGPDLPKLVGHKHQVLSYLSRARERDEGSAAHLHGGEVAAVGLPPHLSGLTLEPGALVEESLLVAPHQLLALALPRPVLPELCQDLAHPLLLGRALRELLIVPGEG